MTFKELEEHINKDFEINEFDLAGEARKNDKLFSKYLNIFKDERRNFDLLIQQKNKLIFEKKQYYSGRSEEEEYNKNPLPDKRILRAEIGEYVENDIDIIKISLKCSDSELKIKMLERIMKRIENRTFDIRNAIEYLKFTQGV